MDCRAAVTWTDEFLRYDFGAHPMHPARLDLTIRLARELGVFDRVELIEPPAATRDQLLTAHSAAYLDALAAAAQDPSFEGYGLGTADDPVFPGMDAVAARIAGGTLCAAQRVWTGAADHAANIAGGLHHAMPDAASGFCVVNDIVVAIRWLLANGAERVAYVDVDVHHGDGVQSAFYDDPRVLTVSLHQHPATLFPGTGLPTETGQGAGLGTAINVALPPGTDDDGWLRAFGAVVPGALRAFAPDILVSQCGCDTHRDDPLADLALSVDGQRAAYTAMHELAHEVSAGRWLTVGGGGYGVVRCVPRAWTSLLAEVGGRALRPDTELPAQWRERVDRAGGVAAPTHLGEGRIPQPQPWDPGGQSWLDRTIAATRAACYPWLGLDPDDPRD